MKSALLVLLIIFIQQIVLNAQNASKCKAQCLSNYVQCATPTTYKVCINDNTYGDVQTCRENTFCSDAPGVCVPEDTTGVNFVCGTKNSGNGNCGDCNPGDIFTCVDKYHFTMCDNRDSYILCPSGKLCIKELLQISELICLMPIVASQLGLQPSCVNTTTSTTPGPPTTPSLDDAKAACIANRNINSSQRYFSIPNPLDLTTCRTYIYCEPVDDIMETTILYCSEGHYYDNAHESCVRNFVNNCDSSPTTISPVITMTSSIATSIPTTISTTISPTIPPSLSP